MTGDLRMSAVGTGVVHADCVAVVGPEVLEEAHEGVNVRVIDEVHQFKDLYVE